MRIAVQRFRMATALSMALWMAALACVTGCVLPSFASAKPKAIACAEDSTAADAGEMDLMADMPNCPHAGHHGPAKPHDGKSSPSGGMTCCFQELNVPVKMHAPQPELLAVHVAVPVAIFDVTPVWTHSAPELTEPVLHAGTDTLLQTQLLRI